MVTEALTGNMVIVGAQWGDEGKGKVVDHYAAGADVVVRFQGGANAGHTLVVEGRKVVLHLIPSGVLRPGMACAIGAGCVVDPIALVEELQALRAHGVSVSPERLRVSLRAHLILPWHRRLDAARERLAGDRRIGTTKRGIGPAYGDAVLRRGVRFAELGDPAALEARLAALLPDQNRALVAAGDEPMGLQAVCEPILATRATLAPFLDDVGAWLHRRIGRGDRVLFEGAQGTMLDVSHGTYPFVTSSATVAGNAAVGAGVGPTAIDQVLGVSKAYCTRVGAGPFPSELQGALGDRLRQAGGEYGATTGRPRRCGWLDAVALRYAARVNGLTALAITKLDVLGGIGALQIVTAYEIDGRRTEAMPVTAAELAAARPICETLEGWSAPLGETRRMADLPRAARALLDRIEHLAGVPVVLVSVGPGREETIER